MRKKWLFVGIAVAGLLICLTVAMQFMKVVDNPPVTQEIPAPANVKAIFRKSCFDCHSNETRITWLQKLPVAAWMVQSDVKGARSVLNFTEWNKYTPMEQDGLIYLAVNAAIKDQMPPSDYLWIHPDTRLTKEDKAVLKNWLLSLSPDQVDVPILK